jgi:hypothetical protein
MMTPQGVALLVSVAAAADPAAAAAPQASAPLVALAADATAIESRAAHELAYFVGRLVGSTEPIRVVLPAAARGKPQLAVGPAAALALGVTASDLSFSALGAEGFLASSNRTALLRSTGSYALSGAVGAGNASTGTLYAAHHLLRWLGVRFYAWDELYVPPPTTAGWEPPPAGLDMTFVPSFEYRDVEGWSAMKHVAQNATRSSQADYFHMNGYTQGEAGRQNDHTSVYATPPGFVHTSYLLFPGHKQDPAFPKGPPQDLFHSHNGWFWPHNDSSAYGQLCWTNQSLIDYLKVSVLEMLSTQPDATIVSISQNDNSNMCKDPAELAVIAEEGSPMGPLLRAVNEIARVVAAQYPRVAVDTLAYQYTQPPPTVTKPEPNVIIRLCDIQSNSGAPLTDPSNANFNTVLEGWNKLTKRIWM